MKVFAKDLDSKDEAEIVSVLDKIESTQNQRFGELTGPHLFGEFSLADITVAPFVPVIMDCGRSSVNLSQHPHV
jgi:glutathione S-transferase